MSAAWIFYLFVLPLLLAAGALVFGYFYTRADHGEHRAGFHPGE